MTCSIEGCDNGVFARSWCSKHYWRWGRHGDPLALAAPEVVEHGRVCAGHSRGWENRPWLSEDRRPGESTTDWCRRLDLYVNARSGVRQEEW